MKDYFKMSMLIIGTVIGAGFASGREILTFFGKFGYAAIPMIVGCGVLFFACFLLLLTLGNKLKTKNVETFHKTVFGKWSIVADLFMLLNYLLVLGSMLSGTDALVPSVGFPYLSIATCLILFFCLLKGVKGLVGVNAVLVPVIVVLMLVTTIANICNVNAGAVVPPTIGYAPYGTVINTLLYVGLNVYLSAGVLINVELPFKVRVRSSATAAGVITLLLVLVVVASLMGGDVVFSATMPMLALAGNLNMSVVAAIVIWLGIFTTILSAVFVLSEWLRTLVRSRILSIILVLAAGFGVSRLGFAHIVSTFYPISGILGVLMMIGCIRYAIVSRVGSAFKRVKEHTKLLTDKKQLKKQKQAAARALKVGKQLTRSAAQTVLKALPKSVKTRAG